MKLIKSLTVFTIVMALGASLAFADDTHKQGGCCKKASKEGKTCEHPCCVEAAKNGKECEKCGGKGDIKKKDAKKDAEKK
jgi:hypothetical protein